MLHQAPFGHDPSTIACSVNSSFHHYLGPARHLGQACHFGPVCHLGPARHLGPAYWIHLVTLLGHHRIRTPGFGTRSPMYLIWATQHNTVPVKSNGTIVTCVKWRRCPNILGPPLVLGPPGGLEFLNFRPPRMRLGPPSNESRSEQFLSVEICVSN